MRHTLIQSDFPKRLTKHFILNGDVLEKEQGGQMIKGTFKVVEHDDLQSFVALLEKLRTNEALVYGIPHALSAGSIVTKSAYERLCPDDRRGVISRSGDCFKWPEGPGIFMIDIDPVEGMTPPSREDAIRMLRDIMPELKPVSVVWYPSSSSHIVKDGGDDLTGLRGQRVYVPVSDAQKIPHLADALWIRAWASGKGKAIVSKSGSILKRTFFDKSVYQPSRLDFAAGASTGPGISQRRGNPEIH